jgi:DNA-binding MarR family transcriptional regulator
VAGIYQISFITSIRFVAGDIFDIYDIILPEELPQRFILTTKKDLNDSRSVIDSYRLFHLLRQTSDAVHKTREVELKKYKLTPEQAGALVGIYSLGKKATPAELSRWLFRERNSITILLNRMHKLGLISKKPDSMRKNIIRLSLTKKGYEAYLHAIEFRSFLPIIDVIIRLKVFEDLHIDPRAYSSIFDKPLAIDLVKPDIDK